jgi:aminomethyltransferase
MTTPTTLPTPTGPIAPLRRTALHPFHVAHGAHLVPFAGWEMPLYYEGILGEHRAVRTSVGLFDVSHMGVLTVVGGHAAALLARRTTCNVPRLVPGQVRYTFLLDATGAIIDDLLVTRIDSGATPESGFLVVPNAANAAAVFDLLRSHRLPDTTLALHNPAVAILAVQGPKARATLEGLFGWDLSALKFYHGRQFPSGGPTARGSKGELGEAAPPDLAASHWVGRTGYTGEAGYELFVRAEDAVPLADRLVSAGVVPCGLGARDTLRLEKGYLLSGQDFHRDRTPIEAAQDRFVEMDHDFVGRTALEEQTKAGNAPRLAGIKVDAPGAIPRHGTPLSAGDFRTELTSGGLSPSLNYGIGLAYLPAAHSAIGTKVELELRGRKVPAEVVALPFYPVPVART